MKNQDECKFEVIRRTFEALKSPKGSPERAALNIDARTSEYMPSERYLLRAKPYGKNSYSRGFRTKREAEQVAASLTSS